MGTRGPLPDPDSGRAEKRKRSAYHPQPPKAIGDPKPPRDLTVEELEVWQEVLTVMRPYGLLSKCDSRAIARLCEATVLRTNAMAVVKKHGPTRRVKARSGVYIVKRPELLIAKQCAEEISRLENSLGLTPLARTRMNIEEDQPDSGAKKDRFFTLNSAG